MTNPSPAATAASSSMEVLCVFCGETIVKERSDDPWFHDETGEERCEGVDEFATTAEDDEDEPEEESATCTAETGHLPGQDHRWQECPTYHDAEDSDD